MQKNIPDIIAGSGIDSIETPTNIARMAGTDMSQYSAVERDAYSDHFDEVHGVMTGALEDAGLDPLDTLTAELAVEAFIASGDLQHKMSNRFEASKHVTQGFGEDAEESMVMEHFDPTYSHSLRPINMAYNIMTRLSSRLSSVVYETFRPFNLGEDAGVSISMDVPEALGNTDHGDGNPEAWDTVKMINLLDSEAEFDTIAIRPIRETCDTTLLIPSATVTPSPITLWGESLTTSPYLFGKEIDFLGASQTPEGKVKGVYNHTDLIDINAAVDKIYVDIGGEIVKFDVRDRTSAHFSMSQQGSVYDMNLIGSEEVTVTASTLNMAGVPIGTLTIPAGYTVVIRIALNGTLSLRKGVGNVNMNVFEVTRVINAVNADISKVDPIFTTLVAEVAGVLASPTNGYTARLSRVNSNLRTLGRIIDTDRKTEEYFTGYGNPVSVTRPVNRELEPQSAQILASYNDIMTVRAGLDKLAECESSLSNITNNGTLTPSITPSGLGAARHVLHTTFVPLVVDVFAEINSLRHKDRESDIGALLTGHLNDMVQKMWNDGNYDIAITTLPDGIVVGKPSVALTTSPRFATILEKYRSELSKDFKWNIGAIPGRRLEKKMYLVFNFEEGTTANSFNTLNFGIKTKGKELVYATTMTRDGATFKSYTVARIGRYFINAPVMGVMVVENWEKIFGRIA